MELQDLFAETAEVVTEYRGRVFKMQVFTEKLSPDYKTKLLTQLIANDEGENKERRDETVQMLDDLIDSWKDKDDEPIVLNGEEFPPVYNNIKQLSFQLLNLMLKNITQYLADSVSPKE